MKTRQRNLAFLFLATVGGLAFWSVITAASDVVGDLSVGNLNVFGPHPGLKDDALKKALRKDHSHVPISYVKARTFLFAEIDGNGKSTVGKYTGTPISYTLQPLPHVGNVEHVWPKSRLPEAANTDLHHLFAVLPEANIARNNLRFGDVLFPAWSKGGSKAGMTKKRKVAFEVRKEARGDIARAMFYIATMYQQEIPAEEEATLRSWHKEDPVDRAEKRRNDIVQKRQKSRNPFIDNQALVSRIRNF